MTDFHDLAARLVSKNHLPGSVLRVTQFCDAAMEKTYDVYRIDTETAQYVMKSGVREFDAYSHWFSGGDFPVPKIYPCTLQQDDCTWFLMEYLPGSDLRQADKETLLDAVQSLAHIHSLFWVEMPHPQQEDRYRDYYRRFIPRFPESQPLQIALGKIISRMESCPRTLIHDDLLPINAHITQKGIRFFDWQYCGIYPYFMDICRLLCHEAGELGSSFPPQWRQEAFDSYYEALTKTGCTVLSPETFKNDIRLGIIAELVSCLQQEDRQQWPDFLWDYYRTIIDLA